MLVSQWASESVRGGAQLKIGFVDIRKAYFNGRPSRNLLIRPPPELGLPKDVVCRLHRRMYCTRDAGSIWESVYSDALTSMGFTQGKASPCGFTHEKWQLSCVVHGDDLTCMGVDASLDLVEHAIQEPVEVKLKGRLGLEPQDANEMRVLNRIGRVSEKGLAYEPGPDMSSSCAGTSVLIWQAHQKQTPDRNHSTKRRRTLPHTLLKT